MNLLVNTRIMHNQMTGVQRYLAALLPRLGQPFESAHPPAFASGMAGHLWEQFYLSWFRPRSVLWSPSNTGPVWRRRQVLTLHDVAPIDHPEWFTGKFRWWYQTIVPPLVRHVHRVVTVSEYSRARIVATCGVAPEKVQVLYPGVEPRFFDVSDADIARVVAKYGLSPQKYVLVVGTLEPRKNLKRFVEAWFRALPGIAPDMVLGIAGGLGNNKIFRSAFDDADDSRREQGRVKLLGYVDEADLPALYAACAVFVYPSLYEGFGLPVLEAMACGAPVLTAADSAMSEVAGGCAALVDTGDEGQIATGLLALLNDPAQTTRLRQAGPARAATFTWDRCAAGLVDVLDEARRNA